MASFSASRLYFSPNSPCPHSLQDHTSTTKIPSPMFQYLNSMMPSKALRKSDVPSYVKSPRIVKLTIPHSVSPMSLNRSVQFTMSPKILKNSQLLPQTSSPKSLKKVKIPLTEKSRNLKPLKIKLFSKYGSYEPPKQANKKRKRTLSDGDGDEYEGGDELQEDEVAESPIRRTRSENPELYAPLPPPTRSRRPKLYPALTPWLDDWNVAELNDSHPEGGFKLDNSDVPDFDLGEPLDETNFWEGPWIAENKDKKRNRVEREKKRKKQLRYGGLKAAGRERAFKERNTMKRENGKFVKLESD